MSLLDQYRAKRTDDEEPQESTSLLDKYRTRNPNNADKTSQETPQQRLRRTGSEASRAKFGVGPESEHERSAFGKSLLSGATVGFSEHYLPLTEDEKKETSAITGEVVGAALPIGLIAKTVSLPIKYAFNLSKASNVIKNLSIGTTTGAVYETGKELLAGEELDPEKIAEKAGEFGTLTALGEFAIKSLEAIPAGVRWLKSLKPAEKARIQVEGIVPENLHQNSYKFFEEEVVPELRAKAESEFKVASEQAEKEAQKVFENEINNVKARHERDQFEIDSAFQKKQQAYEQESQFEMQRTQSENDALDLNYRRDVLNYEQEKQELNRKYNQELANTQAQHEMQMKNMIEANKQAASEYGQQMFEYEKQKNQAKLVKETISKRQEEAKPLQGRVKKEAEELGIDVPAPYKAKSPLHEKVGQIFSNEPVPNTTFGGAKLKKSIQARDLEKYRKVNQAYKLSEEANAGIDEIHPQLVEEIKAELEYLKQIPKPSSPTKNLINTLEEIQNSLVELDEMGNVLLELDEMGNVSGYKPINNQVLLDQVKEMRYMVDHDFAHGKPSGIFRPWIRKIQESAERAAELSGNTKAVEANRNARNLYKEWSDEFDNPVVIPYRNQTNKNYSSLYKSAQERDNFLQIEKILSETPEGIAEINSLKRHMVEEKLGSGNLEKELKELYPIITKDEAQQVRHTINESKKTPVIVAKKVESAKKPSTPKFEQMPETVKIPLKPKGKEAPVKPEPKVPKEKEPPVKEEIKEVKIPHKKVTETPSMRAAANQMDITTTEAMKLTNSVEGLRKLKNQVNSKIWEKIKGDTIKNMLYEGNVKRVFKGDELARVINKGENYALLSEMLGESEASQLLDTAIEIAENKITYERVKKLGITASKLKLLVALGIL